MKCCDTRYEYEIHVKTELIAHKVMGCTCPLSGEKLQGDFPAGITGSKQYGAGVFALVNTLLTVGYVVLPAQMAFSGKCELCLFQPVLKLNLEPAEKRAQKKP